MQTASELTRVLGLGLKPRLSQFGLFKPLFPIQVNSLAELVMVICNKLRVTPTFTHGFQKSDNSLGPGIFRQMKAVEKFLPKST